MMNRNAARHLLLLVSVLLCFFAYMGYRLLGRPETDSREQLVQPLDLDDLNPANASGNNGGAPVLTGAPAPSQVRLRPTAPAEDSPAADAGREDILTLAPPGPASAGNSLKPPESGHTIPPPPSGSIEESTAGNNTEGTITGLVPAPSLAPPDGGAVRPGAEASASGLSVPAPGAAGDGRSSAMAENAPPLLTPPPASPQRPDSSSRSPDAGAASGRNVLPPPPPSGPGLAPPPASSRPPAAAGVPPGPGERRAGRAGETPPPSPPSGPGMSRNGAGAASESLRVYIIQPGDTLNRIAVRELGSIALANNIFLLNRDVISDPDQLIVGERILLPAREQPPGAPRPPRAGAAPVSPVGPARPAPAGSVGATVRVHRVASGDTLSSIALRYYGSSAAWRFLYEANRDVVTNPNRLSIGTELVIPPYGTGD